MKTTVKADKTAKETKEKGTLKELFVLWNKTSKNGNDYLSGMLSDGEKKYLVGYYVTEKKNPKEPDIRVYLLDDEGKQDHQVSSLWTSESKAGGTYLTGITDENEKLVGFYGEKESNRPFIRVYIEEK